MEKVGISNWASQDTELRQEVHCGEDRIMVSLDAVEQQWKTTLRHVGYTIPVWTVHHSTHTFQIFSIGIYKYIYIFDNIIAI